MSTQKTPLKIHLKIITPEKIFFDDEVYEINLTTTAGEISILPDHIPYLSGVKPGIVSISRSKDETVKPLCTIAEGFVELANNNLTILTGEARS